MQFQVPQFIEVEDKIVGPLTFKQFLYLLGGAGGAFLAWRFLPFYAAVPFMLLFGGAGVGFSFIQYNNRPLILAVESAFYFLFANKLYLWDSSRKSKRKQTRGVPEKSQNIPVPIPSLSSSKLGELSWALDVQERVDAAQQRARAKVSEELSGIRTPGLQI